MRIPPELPLHRWVALFNLAYQLIGLGAWLTNQSLSPSVKWTGVAIGLVIGTAEFALLWHGSKVGIWILLAWASLGVAGRVIRMATTVEGVGYGGFFSLVHYFALITLLIVCLRRLPRAGRAT